MKPRALFLCGVALFAGGSAGVAGAQGPNAAAQVHLDRAKAAAYRPGHSLMMLYENVCADALSPEGPVEPRPTDGGQTAPPLANRRIPPRTDWYSEPARVFDNLYWLGSHGDAHRVPRLAGDSTWAVKTSDGIILIDTGNDYSAKELIADGLKKLGEDPAQIKYVVLTHNHGDRYFGARYIQETYHPRVIMSEADWTAMAASNEPVELRPKKDMVATDGMKLTLGDTTLTLYLTPGHTPGTISVLVPLKDGSTRHVGAVWGGINPSLMRYGVRYFRTMEETFRTWSASAARFQEIAAKAGADTYLTIHPSLDDAEEKIHALKYRKPGDPHPLVSKDNLNRFLTIIKECTDAQSARIASQAPRVSVVRDVDYVATAEYPDGKDRLDVYVPQGARNAPVIFSLHGGALSMGDRREESFVGQRFAAAGYVTVVTSYRLSPQVSHPAHIQDAAAAFAWVKRNIRQHGGDPERILIIGHSAGAYLAMLLATDSRWLAAHRLAPRDIAGVAPVSGFFWVDKEGVGPDRPTYVWGPDQKVWVESSPARYLRADLPPVLILDTDGDEGWRQQQNVDLAAALRTAGHKDVTVHKVRGRTHMSVWTEMNDSPSDETSSQILLFARRVLAAKGE